MHRFTLMEKFNISVTWELKYFQKNINIKEYIFNLNFGLVALPVLQVQDLQQWYDCQASR